MKNPKPGQDTNVPSSSAKGVAWADSCGRAPPSSPGGGGAGSVSAAASDAAGGAGVRQRRAPVPKRGEGATPSLIEEENQELREALNASRNEKDVLQCELHAMRLELDTTRELLQ